MAGKSAFALLYDIGAVKAAALLDLRAVSDDHRCTPLDMNIPSHSLGEASRVDIDFTRVERRLA